MTQINLTKQQKKDVLRLVRGYELQNEKTDLENDKINLDKEIKLIQSEIQQLESEREEIERENANITQDNKKLQSDVKDLKRKLVRMKSQKSMIQIQKIQAYNAKEDAKDAEENLQEQKKLLSSFIDVVSTPKKKRVVKYINQFGEEEEEEEELTDEPNDDSPLNQQINKLNQEVSDRCNEISNLKSLLDNSTNLIKKLQDERNEILKSISSPKSSDKSSDKNKKNQKNRTLSKNLDDLASQIISQNEAISRAVKEDKQRTEKASKASKTTTPKQRVVKREVSLSPKQQSQQQQQSSLQVTYLINTLQQKVNSLTEENAKLQSQLTEAEDEREMIFMSLGISKYNTEEDDQKENAKLDKQSDLITKEIQRMKDELSQRLEEVSELKKHLEESTNTILQLRKEHDEILLLMEQNQEEESEYSSNHTSLLENLDELVLQIETQNQSMNQEIANTPQDDNSTLSTSPNHLKQRHPFKRPQTSISEAFKKLQDDLKESHLKIEELEESEQTHQKLVQQLTQRLEQLTDEHQSIMQALYGGEEDLSDGLNGSELIENLNSLNTSISMQNEKINSAIIADKNDDKKNHLISPIISHTPNRRTKSQRPQKNVISALEKIRKDLKDLTESNFDKDQKIEELEAQLDDAKQALELNIKERNIALESESSESQEKISELTKKANEFEARCISSNEQIEFLTKEITKLSRHLNEVESSVKRARSLLGCSTIPESQKDKDGQSLVNFADDLEAQLMQFITKNASEQSGNFTDLEKKISVLSKENDQLKIECRDLKNEKNLVLATLGILDNSGQTSDSEEAEFAAFTHKDDSPLFTSVQKMTQTVEDQLAQINELKANLVQAARTIQHLSNERSSFMQALMPGEAGAAYNQTDSATKKLFKNLEALGLQISKQNDDMNSAIGEEASPSENSYSTLKSPRRERESFQRPQNCVISALEKIRNQLEGAQQEISEKEIKIAELENKIYKLQK